MEQPKYTTPFGSATGTAVPFDPAHIPGIPFPYMEPKTEGSPIKHDTPIDWSKGQRFNEGKPNLYRGVIEYFPNALEEVARVSEYGAKKYNWSNWKKLEDGFTNCMESHSRHVSARAKGEVFDQESKCRHLAHVIWNACAALEFELKNESIKLEETKLKMEACKRELEFQIKKYDLLYRNVG